MKKLVIVLLFSSSLSQARQVNVYHTYYDAQTIVNNMVETKRLRCVQGQVEKCSHQFDSESVGQSTTDYLNLRFGNKHSFNKKTKTLTMNLEEEQTCYKTTSSSLLLASADQIGSACAGLKTRVSTRKCEWGSPADMTATSIEESTKEQTTLKELQTKGFKVFQNTYQRNVSSSIFSSAKVKTLCGYDIQYVGTESVMVTKTKE